MLYYADMSSNIFYTVIILNTVTQMEELMAQSFTDLEYAGRKRKTKRDEFLGQMDVIIPWAEWVAIIKPHYFANKVGRRAKGIETMLRMYLLQSWFNLSDEGCEEAIYDSYAFRKFMGLDFTSEQTPDATTLCKFRKLLNDHGIARLFFDAVSKFLTEHGHMMQGGTIVDATIIAASPSTKNKEGVRDTEMHQVKKGNQWHFGMKAHAGCDCGTGYVHTITVTAANVHDISEASNLIRKTDEVVYGDSGYLGIEKRDEIVKDEHLRSIDYRINCRPSSITKSYGEGFGRDFEKHLEHKKSSVRSKVEHPFKIIKNTFGYTKCIYRGLAKNEARLHVLFASANLLMLARAKIKEKKMRLLVQPLA
jgi:IS5 family transposase